MFLLDESINHLFGVECRAVNRRICRRLLPLLLTIIYKSIIVCNCFIGADHRNLEGTPFNGISSSAMHEVRKSNFLRVYGRIGGQSLLALALKDPHHIVGLNFVFFARQSVQIFE